MLPTRTPKFLKWLYPSMIWEMPAIEKTIYLTFDDGPHSEVTPWVMDLLDKYDFKATFFCIGKNLYFNKEVFRRMIQDEHQVGNHTYDHLKGFKTENKTYFQNIGLCDESVSSELFRPPYGQLKSSQIKVIKKRFKIIMWSLLSEDWNPKLNAALKLKRLIKNTKGGDIVVFHDSRKAFKNLQLILPPYLEFLYYSGYDARTL